MEFNYISKRIVRKKTMEYFKNKIEKEGIDKSKVQYLPEGNPEWKTRKRPEYMNELIRNKASNFFQVG